MSHEQYSPVGYIYQADNYCLDCIAKVAYVPNTYGLDDWGRKRVIDHNGGDGFRAKACNCAECRLDRIAKARGIDRYDEGSFDSDSFPKYIPYHNDIHSECGPEGYGYGPEDDEWREQYCNATCGECHEVIDGTSHWDGRTLTNVCPVFEQRRDNDFATS